MMSSENTTTRRSQPLISVLMAVYNAPPKYLNLSIASILNQSYRDLEFIILDDGSDKVTENILQAWADRDQRIRLRRLPTNIGLTKALNFGLEMARGDYVARQDADDISASERLSAQKKFMELHPALDAVGTNAILIDGVGDKIGVMEIDAKLQGLAQRNLLVHGSMFFRRRVFELIGGYHESMRFAQDYELYLRMMRVHGMKIGVLGEGYYSLRQHSNSLSSHYTFRQFYYSVMAKSLTENSVGRLRQGVRFYWKLLFDFLFIHRLFIGYFLRAFIKAIRLARKRNRPLS